VPYLTKTIMLTVDQTNFYRDNGYLLLPQFKATHEVAALCAWAVRTVDAFDAGRVKSIFTTKEQSRSVDDYFMASASNVSCFFEEEAFDPAGHLKQPKAQSINKIGHAMHDLDPLVSAFSRGPKLAGLARDLGLTQAQIWQSMVIFKQPHIGGEVGWHQDATFFETEPITVTTFWFALEDATLQNGCLWVQPGGHKGPLRERFVKTQGNRAAMESVDTTPWPTQTSAVPLEAKAGDLIILHGLLPHYSAPNRSPRSRMAFTLHVTDAGSTYSSRNWLQRGVDLPVRGFELL
jgi:phytanoyl-CoA hydroxylase